MTPNALFYGDNLDVLRRYIKDATVDLVYLDPPFNSNADYNAFFAEQDGSRAAAQIKAFGDTWRWDSAAALAYDDFVVNGPHRASQAMQSFRTFLGDTDLLAYLAMMAPRLVELHRVLKPSGSIYLHCDPTASHYLKMLMDAVFGPDHFRNEIIWKRTSAHSSAKRYSPVHDVLFFYSKSDHYTWNPAFQPIPQETVDQWYNNVEKETDRRFNRADMTAPGTRSGQSGAVWRGIDPTAKGRHWAIPGFVGDVVKGLETLAALDALDSAGRLYWPKRKGGIPMLKRYLDESPGIPALDIMTDIRPLNNVSAERLGYPTQKPEALLERIIKASSNEGDMVLDPFCGCGTAVAVAQRLNRHWIGIDITHLAIALIKTRLHDSNGGSVAQTYKVIGEPVSVPDAEALAQNDRYQFQYWALGLVGARPTPADQKKGADKGIDGRLYFHDEPEGGKTKQVIFSVKSGKSDVSHVRDLRGVIEREKAAIGVLLTMQDPTGPMRTEAASSGFYEAKFFKADHWVGTKHPRIQILTIAELLSGRKIEMPLTQDLRTFKKAPKAKKQNNEKIADMFNQEDEDES